MKPVTKIKRANKILEILRENKNQLIPLPLWLDLINRELSKQTSFRSTRELTCTFRYIRSRMGVSLVKVREPISCPDMQTYATYYIFKGSKENENTNCNMHKVLNPIGI